MEKRTSHRYESGPLLQRPIHICIRICLWCPLEIHSPVVRTGLMKLNIRRVSLFWSEAASGRHVGANLSLANRV